MIRRLVLSLAFLLLPAPAAFAGLEVGTLTFTLPSGWLPLPEDLPRVFRYRIALPKGDGALVTLFKVPEPEPGESSYGPSQLLTVFAEPAGRLRARIWREEIAGCRVTLVEATGTYIDQAGVGGRRPETTLLGAIFETWRGYVVVRLLAGHQEARLLAPGFWTTVRGALGGPRS